MSEEGNLATARQVFEEAWNRRRLDILDDLVASDYVGHDPAEPGGLQGVEALKERFSRYLAAASDLIFTIEEAIVSANIVVLRWTADGTHDGELDGLPPTYKKVAVTGMTLDRFNADGRLSESWDEWDNLGFMAQLGLILETSETAG